MKVTLNIAFFFKEESELGVERKRKRERGREKENEGKKTSSQ